MKYVSAAPSVKKLAKKEQNIRVKDPLILLEGLQTLDVPA